MEEDSLWTGHVRLRLGKKIQERTYKVFTFGMFHKAMTVTANRGATEAAKMQVVYFTSCWLVFHESNNIKMSLNRESTYRRLYMKLER